MKTVIRPLSNLEEMLEQIEVMKFLYPSLTIEEYQSKLEDMIPYRYQQIGVFLEGQCVALSGFWLHTKIWSGKTLELDNFIVRPEYRKMGLGQQMEVYLKNLALENNCGTMVLDAFVENFASHKFYYNQGYIARGYHFVKKLI